MPFKINRVIGIPQTAVTRDFHKQGASRACPKISFIVFNAAISSGRCVAAYTIHVVYLSYNGGEWFITLAFTFADMAMTLSPREVLRVKCIPPSLSTAIRRYLKLHLYILLCATYQGAPGYGGLRWKAPKRARIHECRQGMKRLKRTGLGGYLKYNCLSQVFVNYYADYTFNKITLLLRIRAIHGAKTTKNHTPLVCIA